MFRPQPMLITLLPLLLISAAPVAGAVPEHLIVARTLAIELSSGKFDAAAARFAPEVAAKLSATALAQQWKTLVEPLGGFLRLGEVKEEGKLIIVECIYESASLPSEDRAQPEARGGEPAAQLRQTT